MATVSSAVTIAAPRADVWRLYFDPRCWPAWADQFAALVSSAGYPEVGGELVWRSGRAGRGEVRERVVEHVPESRHAVTYEDPETTGRLETEFSEQDGATRVSVELTYELRSAGPFAALSDLFFARSQMRASLARSLTALRLEIET